MKCGCRIISQVIPDHQTATYKSVEEISYCPLHAAAPAMLEALKAILRDHIEMERLEGCVCLKHETEQKADAAISQAERKRKWKS